MTSDGRALDCLQCPSLCCKMAGYVEVSTADIKRLAKFLKLTVAEFEAKHILKITRKKQKLIKPGFDACQFLDGERQCTVYPARPKDCRGYVCWEAHNPTLYEIARFIQQPIAAQQREQREAKNS